MAFLDQVTDHALEPHAMRASYRRGAREHLEARGGPACPPRAATASAARVEGDRHGRLRV